MQMPTHLYVKVVFFFPFQKHTHVSAKVPAHHVAPAISNHVITKQNQFFFYCPHESSQLILVL